MIAIAYALLLPLVARSPAPAPLPSAAVGTAPRTLGPVGLAGILVSAAGAGLASTGVVRLAQGPSQRVSPNDRELIITTDPRDQGRVFLGAGLSVAVVGLTALVIDMTLLRSRHARRVALAPFLSPSTAGLVLRGSLEVRSWR